MKRSWIIGAVASILLVAASVGGTLFVTKDSPGKESSSLQPTSMEAWLEELATTGLEPRDPERLWELIKSDTCTSDDFDLYVTLSRGDGMSLTQERVGIKHACPDRLDEWDDAIVQLGGINDRVDFLCETPLEDLSLEEGEGGSAIGKKQ